MEVVTDWESMNVVFQDGPLVLSRVASDALASFAGSAIGDDDDKTSVLDEKEFQIPVEDDLDAVLEALGETAECYALTATPGAASGKSEMDETESDFDDEDHPAILSYSSSDDTSSEKNSSSSSSECGSTTKVSSAKKRQSSAQQQQNGVQKKRTRASAGLSVQEKRELRKLRNRELAAESRKRKNEEMDRLRQENSELKLKIAELEQKLQQQVVPAGRRTRNGTALSASAAVVSLAAFVLMDPSEHYQTASVLLTALDSCDGHLLPSAAPSSSTSSWSVFGFWIVSSLLLLMMCAMMIRMAWPLIIKSVSTFVRTSASSSGASISSSKTLLPRRVPSLTTIANSVV